MRYTLLDPLRGLAALWVLTFHYGFSQQFQELFPLLHAVSRDGDLGVAMFFVISGYCLTASARSASRRHESMGRFLYRRVKRIYPPFWCSILVVGAVPFIIAGISSIRTAAYTAPSAENLNYGYLDYSSADWLRLITLTQVFNLDGRNLSFKFTSINAVYWSLAIEVQFYVVVAFALLFAKRFYTILGIVLLVAIPYAFNDSALRHGIFLPYWPMFACGIVLYFVLERDWKVDRIFGNSSVFWACMVIFALLGMYCRLVQLGIGVPQQIFAPAFAIGLWFATPLDAYLIELSNHRWKVVRAVNATLMVLGAMSYSVYLIHGRLQFLIIQIVSQILNESVVRDMTVIAITVITCYPFYLFCEVPFFRPSVREQCKISAESTAASVEFANTSVLNSSED